MIVLIAAAVCVVGAGMAASEPTEQWNKTFGGTDFDLAGRAESYGSGSDELPTPGFGILAGIISLLGTVYLFRRNKKLDL